MADLKEFEILLHDAEVKLKRLKALYEQWFQGIERIEPLIARKDLDRMFVFLRKEKPRNTAARFRLQQLQSRYNTYQTYWGRIARKIEEGTYERDLRRARRRRGLTNERSRAPAEAIELDIDEEIDLSELEDEFAGLLDPLDSPSFSQPAPARSRRAFSAFSPFAGGASAKASKPKPDTAAPSQPKSATFSRPKASDSPPRRAPANAQSKPNGVRSAKGPPDAEGIESLYSRYVEARRNNNERVDNLKFEAVAASVKEMKSRLKKKHGDKAIDFEVVVRDGRVGLKPKIGH